METVNNRQNEGSAMAEEGENRPIGPRLVAFKVPIGDLINGRFVEVEGKWEPNYTITPMGQKVSRVRVMGRILAKFTNEDGSYGSLTIDDTTGAIRLKAFRTDLRLFKDPQIGDLVDCVCKIRKYLDEVYLTPETVVLLDNPNWELLRRLELAKERKQLRELKETVLKTLDENGGDSVKAKELLAQKGITADVVDAIISAPAIAVVGEGTAGHIADQQPPQPQQPEAAPKEEEGARSAENKIKVMKLLEEIGGRDGADYGVMLQKSGLDAHVLDEVIRELITDGEIFEPKSGRFKRLM